MRRRRHRSSPPAQGGFSRPSGSQKQTCSPYIVPLSHMLLALPPPPRTLRPSWSLLRASQLWWLAAPLSLPALCQQAQRRTCFRCTALPPRLLLPSSQGAHTPQR